MTYAVSRSTICLLPQLTRLAPIPGSPGPTDDCLAHPYLAPRDSSGAAWLAKTAILMSRIFDSLLDTMIVDLPAQTCFPLAA